MSETIENTLWTQARVSALSTKELQVIVRTTSPRGKFAQQLAWAKQELQRRRHDYNSGYYGFGVSGA